MLRVGSALGKGSTRTLPLIALLCAIVLVGALLVACGTASRGQGFPQVQLPAAVTHKPPLAPADLRVATASGQAVAPDTWTNQADLQLAATLAGPEQGATLVPEAEFLPVDQPFTGKPNVTGKPFSTSLAVPQMADGQRYHWQLCAREMSGRAGPWTPFDGTFGYAATPPATPAITPLPNGGNVSQKQIQIQWNADPDPAGIAGFAYALDRQPQTAPPAQSTTADPSATLTFPEDGDWVVSVWAQDNAGNWSAPAIATLHVDTVPLQINDVTYRTFAFNPGYGTLPISFKLTKPASVTVAILPQDSSEPVRTYVLGPREDGVRVEWDGKDESGAAVPSGRYRFRVLATDTSGNTAEAIYDKLLVSQKRIVVSLGRQSLTAYDGDTVILSTLVTTGGPELPTPTGTFQILAKYTPFTFHSPFPKGSPYWYADSPTSYAMLFDDGGYFIHDAPWRGLFGPGSNAARGTPGGNTTGTHGCVNVPFGVQARLFAWADVGTPVVVQW